MTGNLYSVVSRDTIDQLKLLGFRNLQFVLLDPGNPYQAMVEIIPGKDQGCLLDTVSLWTNEINDFGDWDSPMVKYVINWVVFKVDKSKENRPEKSVDL